MAGTRAQVGVRVASSGAAIVSVVHRGDLATIVDVKRPPYDLARVVRAVEAMNAELPNAPVQFVIDGEGVGAALWNLLDHRRDDRFQLYRDVGRARQGLVNPLAEKYAAGLLRFDPGLEHRAALDQALGHYNPNVGDDGVIGSELVVALALAIRPSARRGGYAFLA
jgi:hypothetical protein